MKKIRKRILIALGILLCLVNIYKCFISGHSMPIFKDTSISEYRTVELGNTKQSILIRGENKSNPVLLYLHGGPGDPETSFITPYQKEWEEYFYMLQAPYKELIPISECAHNPIVEKIDDVSDILINKVLLGH